MESLVFNVFINTIYKEIPVSTVLSNVNNVIQKHFAPNVKMAIIYKELIVYLVKPPVLLVPMLHFV